jgi:hypothetical protein
MTQSLNHFRLIIPAFMLAVSLAQAAEPTAPLADPPIGSGKLLLVEDFESTQVGQIPPGFTKTGAVGVVDDVSHSGKKSLRMDAAVNGARKITLTGDILKALAGEHWGRLYFKVQLPTPLPEPGAKSTIIHSTIVDGMALSPDFNDPIDMRLFGTLTNAKGTFSYLFNVQPKKRKEFGKGTKPIYHYTDEWTLAEWHVDYATQTYQLFINGEPIAAASLSNGPGKFEKSEIPEVFQNLSFGWTNYQKASGKGFVTWIDDLALGKDRIGDRGLPTASKSAQSSHP